MSKVEMIWTLTKFVLWWAAGALVAQGLYRWLIVPSHRRYAKKRGLGYDPRRNRFYRLEGYQPDGRTKLGSPPKGGSGVHR